MAPTGVPERLETVRLPVDQLSPYYRNAHQGNVARIRASLREHGQFKPVVVNLGTHTGRPHEVLCGSHTLLAARAENWPELDAVVVDVDDERAAKINLVDNPRPNRPDDLDYDDQLLLELLTDLPDLFGTGYEPDDVANLEALLDEGAWGRGSSKAGGGDAGVDDAAMWPRIDMRVPPEVFDGWRLLLDKHQGKTDTEKLVAVLTELGLL
jgi:ParB-like nuclease family protein